MYMHNSEQQSSTALSSYVKDWIFFIVYINLLMSVKKLHVYPFFENCRQKNAAAYVGLIKEWISMVFINPL